MEMTSVKKTIISAVSVALCVVLPLAFHGIPNAASVFLPMHIPVLLCGLICGGAYGLIGGLLGPFLSSLITGMPPTAYLPSMMIELAAYGLVAGLAMSLIRSRSNLLDLYLSLFLALIVGRIVAGLARALIFSPGAYSLTAWIASYFVTALPGLIIQIILLPSLVIALEKAGLIPSRYPSQD